MRIVNSEGMDLHNTIEAIRKDCKTGADRLVAEYRMRLYKFACNVCGDAVEAEDLVFRTFEQVISKADEYREEDAFFAWMCAILRNYHRMSIRGAMSRNTVPFGGLDELAGISGEVGDEAVTKELDGNILRKAVDELPSKLREVVVLHYFMDQPVRKVAKMLSISKGTVKSRLYYARLVLGGRLCAVLKSPMVALAVAGLFMAAAVSAVSLVVWTPPMVAEVDEPVFLDDAPLAEDDEVQDVWNLVPQIPFRTVAVPCQNSSQPRPRRTVRTAVVPAFRSDERTVRTAAVPAFRSVPGGTKVIISR